MQAREACGSRKAADPHKYLDIVALGTIADVVPLQGENRIIARAGLEMMSPSSNLGLRALIDVSGLAGREIRAGHVSFTVAPRVNAAGRLGDPSLGARLFLRTHARKPELAAILMRRIAEGKRLSWPYCVRPGGL